MFSSFCHKLPFAGAGQAGCGGLRRSSLQSGTQYFDCKSCSRYPVLWRLPRCSGQSANSECVQGFNRNIKNKKARRIRRCFSITWQPFISSSIRRDNVSVGQPWYSTWPTQANPNVLYSLYGRNGLDSSDYSRCVVDLKSSPCSLIRVTTPGDCKVP